MTNPFRRHKEPPIVDPRVAAMVQMSRELDHEMLPTSDSPIYDQVVAEALARDGIAAETSAWLAEQTAGGAR